MNNFLPNQPPNNALGFHGHISNKYDNKCTHPINYVTKVHIREVCQNIQLL